ncbi:hypothetical protein D6833_04570 [Candidatus Parcubacteria bacterium]|nr:MAG: hypothetical protein D6833_04570 [Candidatus Parcubacteria bacterium]
MRLVASSLTWPRIVTALAFPAFAVMMIQVHKRVWIRDTEVALRSGYLPKKGSLGSLTSPVTGCLKFLHRIDGDTLQTFLANSTNDSQRELVVAMIGWKQRSDLLPFLKALGRSGDKIARYATLSAVAIETRIPFPGREFGREYFSLYARRAALLSKEKGVPVQEAALRVAEELHKAGAFD